MAARKKGKEDGREPTIEEFIEFWSNQTDVLRNLSKEGEALSLENYEKEDRAYAELEDERIRTKIAKLKAKVRKSDALIARVEAEARSSHLDNNLRKSFSNKIFWLLAAWMTFIAGSMTFNGLGLLGHSPEVLITLLSSTTVTVVGIFMVVAKNIFPSKTKE